MNICVFLAANIGNNPLYTNEVKRFAIKMIETDSTLVYGGSNTGLMGLLADELLAAGKKVIGVAPSKGLPQEINHSNLSQLIYTENIEARKYKMMEMADIFVALPGGLGTFEEVFSVWNAIRLGETDKPLIIVNINHYFDPLISLVKQAIEAGFVEPEHLGLIHFIDEISDFSIT